jgi:hypothetical protein
MAVGKPLKPPSPQAKKAAAAAAAKKSAAAKIANAIVKSVAKAPRKPIIKPGKLPPKKPVKKLPVAVARYGVGVKPKPKVVPKYYPKGKTPPGQPKTNGRKGAW